MVDETSVMDAFRCGFPRLVVHDSGNSRNADRLLEGHAGVDLLNLSDELVAGWDADRRKATILRSREDFASERLGLLLRGQRPQSTWVDNAFRDLTRAAGSRLPPMLRAFGRRVMEFPGRYDDLFGFCLTTGLTSGALKARFRRKGLDSPSLYLRWFRAMAAAQVLRDPAVTTLQASHRLGFTTDGNFCRAITTTTGLTPTELRSEHGWQQIVLLFARRYLRPDALAAWSSLDPLFQRRRAA